MFEKIFMVLYNNHEVFCMLITSKAFNQIRKINKIGRNYVIEERKDEWNDLCFFALDNLKIRIFLKDHLFSIIYSLGNSDDSIENLAMKLDEKILNDKEWEILLVQVAKFSPRGYEFAINSNRKLSELVLKKIEEIHSENNEFPSLKNKKSIK